MTSSTNPNEEPSASEEQETFLDPNEAFEEYVEDETADHPMSSDEEGEEMYEEEIIVDDSIQGFFLHTSPIYSVALYGNLAATGAGDDLGYVWDVTNGEMIMKLDGHTDSVTNVKFSTDGVFLATGGMDGQVRIWNVREKKLVVTMDAGDEVLVCSPADSTDDSG
jgi:ribosome assembly protein SQT1